MIKHHCDNCGEEVGQFYASNQDHIGAPFKTAKKKIEFFIKTRQGVIVCVKCAAAALKKAVEGKK